MAGNLGLNCHAVSLCRKPGSPGYSGQPLIITNWKIIQKLCNVGAAGLNREKSNEPKRNRCRSGRGAGLVDGAGTQFGSQAAERRYRTKRDDVRGNGASWHGDPDAPAS